MVALSVALLATWHTTVRSMRESSYTVLLVTVNSASAAALSATPASVITPEVD